MKRRVVLIIGYSGTKYHGSQINKNLPTIELEIVNSLLLINAIKEINSKFPEKIGLQRSSRTDKGVHAASAVISVKIEKEILESDFDQIKNYLITKHIHLYKIIRVCSSFNPKKECDSRMYEYLLPTFILSKDINDKTFRITMEELKIINSLFQNFVGTKDYTNFTTCKDIETAKIRYIKAIKALELVYNDNIEYIKVSIHGNSFILHQIRKMIGFVVSIYKFSVERCNETFEIALSNEKKNNINIPKAPSEFLFLDTPVFDHYNNKKATYGKIEVDIMQRNKVKNELIYPEIFKKSNLDLFVSWLEIFEKHDYNFKYLRGENQ